MAAPLQAISPDFKKNFTLLYYVLANVSTGVSFSTATPRLADAGSRRLPDSLTDMGSRFSITNISTNSKPKSKQLES